MNNINEQISNFFAKRNGMLSFDKLVEMIDEQLESMSLLLEEQLPTGIDVEGVSSIEEKVIRFPKIKITERWGQKNNEDREIFETLMNNIKGRTVEEKLYSVSQFMTHQEGLPVSEILSHLMFLEIFSNILEEFNPSVAGFLFEAFLAGLFKGVQIDDPVGGS